MRDDNDIIIIRDSDGEITTERPVTKSRGQSTSSSATKASRTSVVEIDLNGNEITPSSEIEGSKRGDRKVASNILLVDDETTYEVSESKTPASQMDSFEESSAPYTVEVDEKPHYGKETKKTRTSDNNSSVDDSKANQGSDNNANNRKPRSRAITIFGGDKVLWTVITALLIISVLVSYSATVYKGGGTPTGNLIRQFFFIGVGIGSLLLVHFIRYQFYGKLAGTIFVAGLILTAAAIFIGTEAEAGMGGAGARRDIKIPIIGISFQPFEILKIGLIMLLAKRLARKQKDIDSTPILPSFKPSDWKSEGGRKHNSEVIRTQTLPLLIPIFLACLVSYVAVGNSTTLIMGATCFIMFYIGRVQWRDLKKMIALASIAGLVLIALGVGRDDTGRSRVASFKPDMLTKHVRLNADSVEVYHYPAVTKPSGKISPAESDQSISAKMSIATGGIFGKGPGMSTHRSNLSEAEKDFVYAFIIEEYGLIGGVLILLLYLWLFFRAIVIFKKCGTAFPSLLVLGLGLMMIFQAMIHMLVSVSLFPITGQQLPLISKGGSSLVFTLMALGMILGISRQTENKTLDTPKGESLFENK